MSTQFNDISTRLDQLALPVGAAEAHGLLCGLLCGQPSAIAKKRWFGELLDAAPAGSAAIQRFPDAVRELDVWFTQSLEALNDAELGFTPLLPEDSTTVKEQATSLADFCAGFTYGLGIASAGRGNTPLPKDTLELLQDFNAIESGATLDDSTDDAEAALIELIEYVRVGVLLMHEEGRPVAAGVAAPVSEQTQASGTAHKTSPINNQVH